MHNFVSYVSAFTNDNVNMMTFIFDELGKILEIFNCFEDVPVKIVINSCDLKVYWFICVKIIVLHKLHLVLKQ